MGIQFYPDWALSPKSNTISLYHSHDSSLEKNHAPVILIGGVHGDEPEGVELAERSLQWLKEECAKATSCIQVPWILIPCLNVDGFKDQQRVNGNGVDLNRNYPSTGWSPEFKKERYYPGKEPGSEPEIQALTALIEATQPRLVIHCHSWEPSVVLSGPPALADAQALSQASGYPVQDSIGYPTPGSLSEYCWNDRLIPVICIEEQEHSDLALVWPHFAEGIRFIFSNPSQRRSL